MKRYAFALLLVGFLPASAQVLDKVDTPPQQNEFNAVIDKFRVAYTSAANEMAAGSQRTQRAKDICKIIANKPIKDWTGFITKLSSNSDGLGVMEVETGKGVKIGTWNNAFSDVGDNTLIKGGSNVMKNASSLPVGQAVRFSGSFIKSNVDCIKEASITINGSMTTPFFLFRFSHIEKIGDIYAPPDGGKKSWLRSLF